LKCGHADILLMIGIGFYSVADILRRGRRCAVAPTEQPPG
jgi:hypothetical protein